MKKALITGSLGQDGSYMAEYLLSLGYEVWGTARMDALFSANLVKNVHYVYADLRDELSMETVIRQCHPDEIYNFAGQVFVPTSWEKPAETFDVNTAGFARLLKVVEKVCPNARVYQASSSEMYGNVLGGGTSFLDELSAMHPVSPYGVSKYAAHKLVDVHRQKGMYVVSGIAFNHESPRRGMEMVTRKISRAAAEAKVTGKATLKLGNVETKRDWGFAGDYVKAMHKMLQQPTPEDFVIGTGRAHSVAYFCDVAWQHIGRGDALHIEENCPEFSRPNELHTLIADTHKITQVLGWKAETYFEQLVRMMVEADIKQLEKNQVCAEI